MDKTLVFDNGSSATENLVAASLFNRGNGNGNGYGGYGWEWLMMMFMWALFGGYGFGGFGGFGRGGFGGFGGGLQNLPAELNGDAGRQLLMNAIQGNGNAISQLASSFGCSTQQIQAALSTIQSQLGLSGQQIINAVESGNAGVISQMQQCCCNIREAISGVNVGMERGFSSIAFNDERNKCDIVNTIRESSQSGTTAIIAKLDQMQTNALQDKVDEWRTKYENAERRSELAQQNSYTAGVVAQAIAPLTAAVSEIKSEVDAIKCKLPNTVAVPYPQLKAYNPECFNAAAMGAAYGEAYGLQGAAGGFWR